ncbi:MAG: hypothetical protein J7L86_00300 [Candidatus Marinimicrobia bacterium]|nr:hypothetical protein [Candidatus Neomarinimicrobiota bacterium]
MEEQYTFYHLCNLGCNKEPIFLKEDHHLLFLIKIKSIYQKNRTTTFIGEVYI